jgi:hypothetical protein
VRTNGKKQASQELRSDFVPCCLGIKGIADVHYSFVVFYMEKKKFAYHIRPFFP